MLRGAHRAGTTRCVTCSGLSRLRIENGCRAFRFRDFYCFDDDTVVLEFAYTFRRFRGLGIMAPAMAFIAEQGKGAHWAITYVDRSNIPSLRGCHSAGFSPHRLCCDTWRLFRLRQSVMEPTSLEPFWNKGTA